MNTTNIYNNKTYNYLKKTYGSYASWAVWNDDNLGDISIIESNIEMLHSKYVLIALNKSIDIDLRYWKNFHGGSSHDRKLSYACNHTKLRGSYMTDLFKDLPETVASNIDSKLESDEINKNVKLFMDEMKDVKISPSTKFIIFGNVAFEHYEKYFNKHFDNQSIKVRHYSDYSKTDDNWVKEFWQKLNNEKY